MWQFASHSLEHRHELTHTIFLRENSIPIIEGFTNIDKLTKKRMFLLALPLKISGLEASPIRAIAIEEWG